MHIESITTSNQTAKFILPSASSLVRPRHTLATVLHAAYHAKMGRSTLLCETLNYEDTSHLFNLLFHQKETKMTYSRRKGTAESI